MKHQVPDNPVKNRNYPFSFTALSCAMAVLYLVSNIMAVRIIRLGSCSIFDGGTLTFPFAYMIGDTLTELWGFKTAKKVIYLTFGCNILMVFFTGIGVFLPYPAYQHEMVQAYEMIFTYVPRIVAASLAAFLAGELVNAWLMEKIKEKTGEKHLWIRTIGSSAAGHLLDTALFVLAAFAGTVPARDLFTMTAAQYFMKLGIETLAGTPLAYVLVGWLKGSRKHE